MSFNTQHTASYYAATARDAAPYPSLDADLSADVCVVGGGLTGVNTALELAERGLSVVVDRYLVKPTDADATNELGDALKAVIWCQNNGNRGIPDQSLQAALRPLYVHPAHGELVITTLARCAELRIGDSVSKPDGSVSDIVRGVEIYLVVAGKIDLDKERLRLSKEIERLTGALAGVEKKLSNPNFVANAKPEVIDVERQKQADWADTLAKLQRNLASM